MFKSIDHILQQYGVKSFKTTEAGLVAIRTEGVWCYFRFVDRFYCCTGSTKHFKA